MRVRVQKWGNSLALRIPKSFATELDLVADTEVELILEDGRLAIEPIVAPAPTLDELLAGVTPHNLHGEIDTGVPVGQEAW